MDRFRIKIASLPDRENVVAEIVYDHVQWAEISDEKLDGNLVVQCYSYPKQKFWEFPLDEAIKVLENAKRKLIGMGGIKS